MRHRRRRSEAFRENQLALTLENIIMWKSVHLDFNALGLDGLMRIHEINFSYLNKVNFFEHSLIGHLSLLATNWNKFTESSVHFCIKMA